jgi:hypothetical protein
MTDTPKGVMHVFVSDGRVVAHAADFHPDRPGGYTTRDAQRVRSRQWLNKKVLDAYCSTIIGDSLDSYQAEQVV